MVVNSPSPFPKLEPIPGEPLHSKIIMGIGCYNQKAVDAADKVSLVKLHGFRGISLFSYDNHIHDLSWFNQFLKNIY